jgi:hypothetical protein
VIGKIKFYYYNHTSVKQKHEDLFLFKFYAKSTIFISTLSTWQGEEDLSQDQQQQLSPCHSPSSLAPPPLSPTLPSFLDTYTPSSIITTIEPRVFGSEAEFRRRLHKQDCEAAHYTPLNIR